MAISRDQQIKEYGWTALSCNPQEWGGVAEYNKAPVQQLCADVPLPDTPVVRAAMAYVKEELPEHTFNHSMRVFYYGTFSRQCQLLVEIAVVGGRCSHTDTSLNVSSRHGHRHATVPLVAIQPRDVVVDVFVSRYRDRGQAHARHAHVVRVLRRDPGA